jgi:hypothetical protein
MAIRGKEDVVLVVPGEVDHHGDPAAEEITGDDRVIVRGDEWRITGTPADQRTMKSKRLGLQMVVGRIA